MENEYIVRDVFIKDLINVARIHKNIFYDHMLGQLPVFLIEKFYQSCLNGITKQSGVFLLCTDRVSGEVMGFVLGGESAVLNRSKVQFVRKNFLAIIFCGVLFNPKIYPFIWNRIFGNKNNDLLQDLPVQPTYRLLSIGVCDRAKGTGIAKMLIKAYERLAFKVTDVYGLSVHNDNQRAVSFYKKMGLEMNGMVGKSYYMKKSI